MPRFNAKPTFQRSGLLSFDRPMSAGPDITETAPETPDADAARHARQQAILDELAEAGLEIALMLKARIAETAAPDPNTASATEYADLTRAFDRASRATRMAIALSRQLAKDGPAGVRNPRAAAREARDHQAGRALSIVRRMALTAHIHPESRELVDRHARERLFDRDITGDILSRPMGELVAQLCADLGVPPHWRAMAEEAWAQEEIAERPPGSPYAAWPDLPPDPDPEDLWGDDLWEDDEDDDEEGDEPDDPGGGDP